MPETTASRWNWTLWLGFLLALGAVLCNGVFFLNLPGPQVIPWLSLLLAVVAFILLINGLMRVFRQPRIYRGKVFSSIVSVVSLLLVAFAIFAFFRARELPASAAAPQVGQKAPEFTLVDTTDKPVSLDQLFASGTDSAPAPKAVLLVFYRGYW